MSEQDTKVLNEIRGSIYAMPDEDKAKVEAAAKVIRDMLLADVQHVAHAITGGFR